MRLNSIRLENIRSYTNHEINFPEGSVLLSGDIGSGKSTILLAIEFALFGIRAKQLSGNSLLRNGKNTGSVELRFDIDNKDIIIKRSLKRSKDNVKQETGYIITDGTKKEATPVELKTDILNLLGYPKELITKSKNFVYRYTVYTPQEEMKQILTEEEDARLDTLRRVFGIDRYKRIKENSMIVIRDIKEKRKEYEGKISDLQEKKQLKQEKEKRILEFDDKINVLIPRLNEIISKISIKKESVIKTEKDIQEQNKIKRELEVAEANLRNKVEQRERNKQQIEFLERQIKVLRGETTGKSLTDFERLQEEKHLIEEQFIIQENRLNELDLRIRELSVKKKSSIDTKNKIVNLDNCPMCEQYVSIEHKRAISTREDNDIEKYDNKIAEYNGMTQETKQNLQKIDMQLEGIKKKEQEFHEAKIKLKNIDEKEKTKDELIIQQDSIKKDIGSINIKKMELQQKISKFTTIEEDYKQLRQELDLLSREERKIEIEKTGLEKEKQLLKSNIDEIEKEIVKKLKIKERLNYIYEMQNWIETGFINLMNTIEKQVMYKVYNQFNELFEKWFKMLIDDETINARLDDKFTPIIEQNGYETAVDNLSGGEKTSVALAYRLALNKVVNELMEGIKTKDLIILDEPTDGFSTEQLDKVRDVLDELCIDQTIIVSHESKIESFVDNVIRINKNEHVSEIV